MMRVLCVAMGLVGGATIVGMGKETPLCEKSFQEVVAFYRQQGKSDEAAVIYYNKAHPSFYTLFGNDYHKVNDIVKVNSDVTGIVGNIKSLVNQHNTWQRMLREEHYTKCLLRTIERARYEHFYHNKRDCLREKKDDDIFLPEALVLDQLGTFGAIALKKKCVMIHADNPEFVSFFRYNDHLALRTIVQDQFGIERIVKSIKLFADQNKIWKMILNEPYYTQCLLRMIEFEKADRCINERYDAMVHDGGEKIYLREELVLVLLGTPGAIALGKKYITIPARKESLIGFLGNAVCSKTSEQYGCSSTLSVILSKEEDDLDLVKAGLAMGIDPFLLHKNGKGHLLRVAKASGKEKLYDLLVKECSKRIWPLYCLLNDKNNVFGVLPKDVITYLKVFVPRVFI